MSRYIFMKNECGEAAEGKMHVLPSFGYFTFIIHSFLSSRSSLSAYSPLSFSPHFVFTPSSFLHSIFLFFFTFFVYSVPSAFTLIDLHLFLSFFPSSLSSPSPFLSFYLLSHPFFDYIYIFLTVYLYALLSSLFFPSFFPPFIFIFPLSLSGFPHSLVHITFS